MGKEIGASTPQVEPRSTPAIDHVYADGIHIFGEAFCKRNQATFLSTSVLARHGKQIQTSQADFEPY